MGIADREVRELVVLRELQVVSLDAPVDDDGDVTLAEVIEDTGISSDEDVSSLEDVLKHLSEQERAVILVRYGFGDSQPCTQAETAQVLGMKLRRVQELDWRARIRLRRVLELQAS
jgi:RNA polymerase nonessential primary-like sigma factor